MPEPRSCLILVPFSSHIAPACEQGLIELQRRGYDVWRVGGYANIDIGRGEMATKALKAGYEETFWIDSDIQFSPDDVERLRAHNLPISCGIYARKGSRSLAAQCLPGTTRLSVGRGGGLCEILYAATGFLHVRREVYAAIQQKLALPLCNARWGRPMIPFFHPLIIEYESVLGREGAGTFSASGASKNAGHAGKGTGTFSADDVRASAGRVGAENEPVPGPRVGAENEPVPGHWYLGDDFSFCERARD